MRGWETGCGCGWVDREMLRWRGLGGKPVMRYE